MWPCALLLLAHTHSVVEATVAVAAVLVAAPIWFYSTAIACKVFLIFFYLFLYFCDFMLDGDKDEVDVSQIVKCFSVVVEAHMTEHTLTKFYPHTIPRKKPRSQLLHRIQPTSNRLRIILSFSFWIYPDNRCCVRAYQSCVNSTQNKLKRLKNTLCDCEPITCIQCRAVYNFSLLSLLSRLLTLQLQLILVLFIPAWLLRKSKSSCLHRSVFIHLTESSSKLIQHTVAKYIYSVWICVRVSIKHRVLEHYYFISLVLTLHQRWIDRWMNCPPANWMRQSTIRIFQKCKM